MTLAELKKENPDIVLEELRREDLESLATGAALFYVSLSSSSRPKDARAVRYAGHVLTQGMTSDGGLVILRMTANGNPKRDIVYPGSIAPDGTAALYRTQPMAAYDSRNLEPWNHWNDIF